MTGPRGLRSFLLAFGVVFVVASGAAAGWRTEEPSCAPSRQPGSAKNYALSGLQRDAGATDWVEPWAEWWWACTTAAEGNVPALCQDGRVERATDKDGGCLTFVCRGGTYDIRSCANPEDQKALPRIAALRLFPNGYAALVEHRRGSKEDPIAAGELPLGFVLRALMNGSKLPDADLKRVPASFWQRQRPIAVVERSRYAAEALVATAGGRR
jgi:hypothetical protein